MNASPLTRLYDRTDLIGRDFFEWIDQKPWVFLLFLITVTALIRGWNLGGNTIWLDEAYSIFHAQKSFPDLLSELSRDSNPPLYNVLLKIWIDLTGSISELNARIPSFLFSLGSLIVLFRMGRKLFNIETAVFASLLFTVSQQHLIWAQNARSYALSSLICLISFYSYFRLMETAKWKYASVLGVSSLLLILSHYTNFFVFGIQAFGALLWVRKNPRAIGMYVLSQIAALLVFLPWAWFFSQNSMVDNDFAYDPNYFGDWRKLTDKLAGGRKMVWVFAGFLLTSFPVVGLLGLRGRINVDLKKLLILLGWGVLILVVGWYVSRVYAFYEAQYFLYTSLGLMLAFGYLLSTIPLNRTLKLLLLAGCLIVTAKPFLLKPWNAEDWRGTMQVVNELKAPENPNRQIIYQPWYESITFAYYFDRSTFEYGYLDPMFEDLRKQKVNMFDLKNYEESYAGQFQEKGVDEVLLIQSRFSIFDPDSLFPKRLAQDYELIHMEEIAHNRISHFRKK